jgi:nitrogen fixation protein NifU and related proteins
MQAPAHDLTGLYREIVLDHSRHPRNQRRPARFDREAEGHNPLCGDKVHVYLQLDAGNIQDIAFEASGCAICLASASLMTETVHSRPIHDARASIDRFERALANDNGEGLSGDLAAFGGVSRYPSRIRCATLPWKTLRAALDAASGTAPGAVSTEQMSLQR